MTTQELKTYISTSYAERLEASDGCCEPSCSSPIYSATEMELMPEGVVSFGCGNPVALSSLRAGDRVLDLGSGAGMDCFLAAQEVGLNGAVIGVDFTPTMIERAGENAAKLGLENVSFRLGDIEALPVDDSSVDLVMSNCVINLAPDKDAVFRESFRVLTPGGRVHISDMMSEDKQGPARTDAEAWTSCIAGAEDRETYLGRLAGAGFVDIEITEERERLDEEGIPTNVVSVKVVAHKPG